MVTPQKGAIPVSLYYAQSLQDEQRTKGLVFKIQVSLTVQMKSEIF